MPCAVVADALSASLVQGVAAPPYGGAASENLGVRYRISLVGDGLGADFGQEAPAEHRRYRSRIRVRSRGPAAITQRSNNSYFKSLLPRPRGRTFRIFPVRAGKIRPGQLRGGPTLKQRVVGPLGLNKV